MDEAHNSVVSTAGIRWMHIDDDEEVQDFMLRVMKDGVGLEENQRIAARTSVQGAIDFLTETFVHDRILHLIVLDRRFRREEHSRSQVVGDARDLFLQRYAELCDMHSLPATRRPAIFLASLSEEESTFNSAREISSDVVGFHPKDGVKDLFGEKIIQALKTKGYLK